jgi:hypothetical protein
MTEDTNIQELQDSPELHPADIADALQQLPP